MSCFSAECWREAARIRQPDSSIRKAQSGRALLAQPYLRRFSAFRAANHIGSDYDQKFIVFFLLGTLGSQCLQARDLGESWQAAQAFLFGLRDHSRHYCRLAFLQRDSCLVFTIGNDRHAVQTCSTQSAEQDLQLHAYIGGSVDRRLDLNRESQIFIAEGRERRRKALVTDYL